MSMFDKYIGNLVVIKWELKFLNKHFLDPIDPDSWNAIGFLAKNNINNNYGLIFSPFSFEYKNGHFGINSFEEEEVCSISQSNSNQLSSQLSFISLQFMSNNDLSFGCSQASSNCYSKVSTCDDDSCKIIDKDCNNCSFSNLFNLTCRKTGHLISNLKGNCSEWKP